MISGQIYYIVTSEGILIQICNKLYNGRVMICYVGSSRYIKKQSLSNIILLSLEKAVDGYIRLEDFLYNTHIYARGYDRPLKKSEFSQALKRLRERGLVVQDFIDEDKIIFKLTSLGRDVLGGDALRGIEWDGIWRVVVFDIPEDKRRIRDQFRRKLKHWGFKNWQQSVWVSKNNVTDKLRSLIEELGIGQWVAVLESNNISVGNKLFNGR